METLVFKVRQGHFKVSCRQPSPTQGIGLSWAWRLAVESVFDLRKDVPRPEHMELMAPLQLCQMVVPRHMVEIRPGHQEQGCRQLSKVAQSQEGSRVGNTHDVGWISACKIYESRFVGPFFSPTYFSSTI